MIRALSLLALFLALPACGEEPAAPAPTPAAPTRPDVANSRCPVCPSEVGALGDGVTIVEYGGERVGFCCPSCVERWDVMSDEEKRARLAQVR